MARRPLRGIKVAAAALVIAVALLAGCGGTDEPTDGDSVADVNTGPDDGFHAAVLPEPYDVPDVPLRDTDGAPFSLAADTERPLTLIFFGYTNCPDICQAVMASIAAALNRLDDAQREQVDVVFVTTDPARDDEAALRDYLDRFDPSFIGLTGELSDIKDLGEAVGVFIEKGKKLPTGGYEVDHGTPVLGLRADDRVALVWTGGTSPAQFADDIAKELDS